jgi:hypothetical protein
MKRRLRTPLLAGVVSAALLVPAGVATAMPIDKGPYHVPPVSTVSPAAQSPDGFVGNSASDYASISTPAASSTQSPDGFVGNPAADFASVPAPEPTSVVSTPAVHTVVTDHGDQTLAVILASTALGVALLGAGWTFLRRGQRPSAALR